VGLKTQTYYNKKLQFVGNNVVVPCEIYQGYSQGLSKLISQISK